MRYTFNLKKAYDDYYLYSGDTVYSKGERPRSEYVSPYKENYYIPEHNITRRMCYNKLGQYEDIDESPEHLAKVSKALEIIKKKVVFYWQLRFFENYDNYFIATYSEENKENILSRAEFDLIKEWLER